MSVWFITGASRGFGTEITRQALGRGDQVVATARHPGAIRQAVPDAGDALLALALDVTSAGQAAAAVSAAVARFGRIDALVNNAGRGLLGAVEEVSDGEARAVFDVNVFGLLTVTRAVLPVMRKQRAGYIISISSGAGLAGFEFNSAYAAAKFGLEGWMESLQPEVAPFGIRTTLVNPGMFRTELLTEQSTTYAEPSIEDYVERGAAQREGYEAQNGRQAGDPAKLAQALVTIAGQQPTTKKGQGRCPRKPLPITWL